MPSWSPPRGMGAGGGVLVVLGVRGVLGVPRSLLRRRWSGGVGLAWKCPAPRATRSVRARTFAGGGLTRRKAVGQAVERPDPRFHVHLDRIESRLLLSSPGVAASERPHGVVHDSAGDVVQLGPNSDLLENFSWQGRALLFGSLCMGFALNLLLTMPLAGQTLEHQGAAIIAAPFVPGTPPAGLLVVAGVRLSRLCAFPFAQPIQARGHEPRGRPSVNVVVATARSTS